MHIPMLKERWVEIGIGPTDHWVVKKLRYCLSQFLPLFVVKDVSFCAIPKDQVYLSIRIQSQA